jgi:phosphoribosylformylglycinamidine synthase I
MSSKVLIVEFPGSSVEEVADAYTRVLGIPAQVVWHDTENLPACELLVIPGGSSFSDYLRPGALAKASAISAAIRRHSRSGKVLGIGNGFQIMCEYGILPGALLSNIENKFVNEDVYVRPQESILVSKPLGDAPLKFPLACEFGSYFIEPRRLAELQESKLVVFRYTDKEGDLLPAPPTGSQGAIAGLTNTSGNVLGIMFHPERMVESEYGGEQGRAVLTCLLS